MKNVKQKELILKDNEWSKYLDQAFDKIKDDVEIKGFRKGSITKDVYIRNKGIESLYMDAADFALQDNYENFMTNNDLKPIVEPKIDIVSVTEDEIKFNIAVIERPEVKLGKYKNLGVEKEEAKVTKEEVKEEIENTLETYADSEVTEEAIAEGFTAIVDFKGYVDEKMIEGGSGEDYPLEIGSNTFIPGFEEGLIGLKSGDKKTLELTFPENYTEELKNKDVTFEVEVKEVKKRVLPKIDKDLFEDLGLDIETEEEFNKHIEETILERKKQDIDNKYVDEVLTKAIENLEVEVNEEIVEAEVERIVSQYSQELQMQGLDFNQYLEFTGSNIEDFKETIKPEAMKRIKSRFMLEEIAEKEDLTVTKKEVDEELEKLSEAYQMEIEELKAALGSLEFVEYDIKMQKAIKIITA